ncbi:MAG: type IX secretion system outer membrane channel protein PorV [Bacteroidales bacterium]|nr:type IX secretion system outer membrane channel protein PorV [Bacteroidales bacterium]
MKNKAIALLLAFILVSGMSKLSSQDPDVLNAIQTVVPFLTIAPDSRSGAMGDAGVATSPDIFSMHWNPSKFAFIDGTGGVGISYSPWLRNLVPDIDIAYLSGYSRIDSRQVISGSLLYSSLGDVVFTDEYGNMMQVFKANEFSIDVGYSRLFSEKFSGGTAFRFIYSNLTGGYYSGGEATKPGISFAADISGYYQTDATLFSKDALFAFGVNFANIGSKMSYSDSQTSDFIPMTLRLGTSGTIDLDNFNQLTLTIDLGKFLVPTPPIYNADMEIVAGKDPNVSVPVAIFRSFYDAPGGFKEEMREITYSFGTEYWYNNQFAIRAGYFHEHQTKGNRKYFTAGAGFRLKGFTIDFSYLMPRTNNHPLARTLRFSLSFDINSMRSVTTPS